MLVTLTSRALAPRTRRAGDPPRGGPWYFPGPNAQSCSRNLVFLRL